MEKLGAAVWPTHPVYVKFVALSKIWDWKNTRTSWHLLRMILSLEILKKILEVGWLAEYLLPEK